MSLDHGVLGLGWCLGLRIRVLRLKMTLELYAWGNILEGALEENSMITVVMSFRPSHSQWCCDLIWSSVCVWDNEDDKKWLRLWCLSWSLRWCLRVLFIDEIWWEIRSSWFPLIMRFQISRGRDKIPLMMGWLCMFLGFGFHEITAMPPSRYRVIIPVES